MNLIKTILTIFILSIFSISYADENEILSTSSKPIEIEFVNFGHYYYAFYSDKPIRYIIYIDTETGTKLSFPADFQEELSKEDLLEAATISFSTCKNQANLSYIFKLDLENNVPLNSIKSSVIEFSKENNIDNGTILEIRRMLNQAYRSKSDPTGVMMEAFEFCMNLNNFYVYVDEDFINTDEIQ